MFLRLFCVGILPLHLLRVRQCQAAPFFYMLSYTVYPAPMPAASWVVFIHGAGGSSAIWYKQLRDFKEKHHVLLIDLRGHGRSKKLSYDSFKQYSFDVIGNDVLEVLDKLRIDSAHFIGISLGTIIIRDLAERFPERVRSMVMGGAVMKLNLRGQFLMKLGNLLKNVLPYLVLYRFLAFIIMPRKKHRESRNLFVREAKKLYQKEFIRWFTLTAEVNPLLSLFRMKDTGLPTLYVMGAEDYMFLPSIAALVKQHKSAVLQVVPDCGHVVNVEKPVFFNEITLQFLAGIDNPI